LLVRYAPHITNKQTMEINKRPYTNHLKQ
jgi:hypothetical protein